MLKKVFVSIPVRVSGFLERRALEKLDILSFQGAFARNKAIIRFHLPIKVIVPTIMNLKPFCNMRSQACAERLTAIMGEKPYQKKITGYKSHCTANTPPAPRTKQKKLTHRELVHRQSAPPYLDSSHRENKSEYYLAPA
jgi:hypothetical protein